MKMIEIGILLVFIGFLFIITGALMQAQQEGKAKVAFGGFIGPIPFGFANDKTMLWVVIGISLIIFITWIILKNIG